MKIKSSILAVLASAACLVTAAKADTTPFDSWLNMTNSSQTTPYTTPGAGLWTFGSNGGGSGDANLQKISGGAYMSGVGLMSAAAVSGFSLKDLTPAANIQSISLTFTGSLTGITNVALNLNGGTQALAASTAASGTYTWDVSGFGSEITAYDIGFSLGVFQSVTSITLTTSAVPEPSTYAAIFGAGVLGLALWNRRRASRAARADGVTRSHGLAGASDE